MAKGDHLGELEFLVMTGVMVLGDEAYGLKVFDEVNTLTEGFRSVSLGAIYITLDRLEEKGFCTSWYSDPTPERGGRKKRFYKVTASGASAVRGALKIAVNMMGSLHQIGVWADD